MKQKNEGNKNKAFGPHWEKISKEREKEKEMEKEFFSHPSIHPSTHPSFKSFFPISLEKKKKMCDRHKTQVIGLV